MTIYINSIPKELPASAHIQDALSAVSITSPNGIAIAINNNVVPKPQWDTYPLQPEDKITIIKATQGG
jgi:sulfur carrier protein